MPLLAYLEVVKVPAFGTVVNKGDHGDALFMVLEGEVRARVMIDGPTRTQDYQPRPKWRRGAKRPSCLDLVTLLRKQMADQPPKLPTAEALPTYPARVTAAAAEPNPIARRRIFRRKYVQTPGAGWKTGAPWTVAIPGLTSSLCSAK